MRILTWNIHGASLWDRDERFPIIRNAIEQYQPDIACIQEAFFPKSRKMLKSIEEYHVSYKLNWLRPPSTKGGLVTLTKTEPLEVSFHRYQAQGDIFTEQRWDRLLGKGILETVIEDPQFGKVTIKNTHKVSTYEKEMDHYLEAQASQLLQRVSEHQEGLLILTGDLNFRKRSKLYPQFKELLHDATESLQKFHLFEYENIDYIFVSEKHRFEAAYVHHLSTEKYPSDHPGIVVDITPHR